MNRTTVIVVALLFTSAIPLMAGDKKLESGRKKGENVPTFGVKDITGPHKDKTLCYIWVFSNKPVAIIFTKEVDEGLVSLTKEIDSLTKKKKNSKAFVVVLNENAQGSQEKLKKLAKDHKINIPLTFNKDPKTSTKFKINKDVKYTVLIYEKKKVVANFAFNEMSKENLKKISDTAKKHFKN